MSTPLITYFTTTFYTFSARFSCVLHRILDLDAKKATVSDRFFAIKSVCKLFYIRQNILIRKDITHQLSRLIRVQTFNSSRKGGIKRTLWSALYALRNAVTRTRFQEFQEPEPEPELDFKNQNQNQISRIKRPISRIKKALYEKI